MKNKLLFTLSALMWVISGSLSAQRLISDSLLRHYTKAQTNALFTSNGIPVSSPYGFSCYRLVYETLNAQQTDTTIASGLIVVPDSSTCPMALAMYDHGTVCQRKDVPSYLNYEAVLVDLLAGEGYVGLGPDYLGLGVSPGFHPYIHALSEAQAGVDLIFAAKTFAAQKNIALSEQLFLTGYSQGGHACMATHRLIQENYAGQLTVTASSPGSGPYNMSGIQTQGFADDSFYADPAYIPYLIFSYQFVYGNLYDSVQQYLRHPYDSILPPLYYGQNLSAATLNGYLPNYIDSFVVMSQLNAYASDSINNPLRIDLRLNDDYAWTPTSPVQMTYCTEDEQVKYENTIFTYNYFLAHGDSTATKLDGGAYTHENCVNPAILNMITLFNSLRVNENNLSLTFTVDSSSPPGANNARIQVAVTGGTGYAISWSTGSTDSIITGLSDGTYTVTVTDSKGCTKVRSVNPSQVSTGINALSALLHQFQVFPNPATAGQLNIKVTGFRPDVIAVYDVNGKLMQQMPFAQQIDVSQLSAGVYMLEVRKAQLVERSRFVKM